MDPEDQNEIIKKVKTEGQDNPDVVGDDSDKGSEGGDDEEVEVDVNKDVDLDFDEEDVNEGDLSIYEEEEMQNIFTNPKKNNMFQPGSNDVIKDSIYENLHISEKSSIFTQKIKNMLRETFNQDEVMDNPVVEPKTKPVVKPEPVAPSRRNRPFLPTPEVNPDPKAVK